MDTSHFVGDLMCLADVIVCGHASDDHLEQLQRLHVKATRGQYAQ